MIGRTRTAETITTVAVITVGLSVLLHGLTAYPGSQRYAAWSASHDDPEATKAVHRLRLRLRLRLHQTMAGAKERRAEAK